MRKLTSEEEDKLLKFLDTNKNNLQVKWFFELMQALRADEDIYCINETDHVLSDFSKGRVQACDFFLDYYDNLEKKMIKFNNRKKRG